MLKRGKKLSKSTKIIIAIVLSVALGLTVYLVLDHSTTGQYDLGVNSYQNARELPIESACLAPDASLDISPADRSAYEIGAVTYLLDVPAGTNVDVNVASVSENEVTGSDIYPEEYGSYNFVLNKQDNNWVVTNFTHCE